MEQGALSALALGNRPLFGECPVPWDSPYHVTSTCIPSVGTISDSPISTEKPCRSYMKLTFAYMTSSTSMEIFARKDVLLRYTDPELLTRGLGVMIYSSNIVWNHCKRAYLFCVCMHITCHLWSNKSAFCCGHTMIHWFAPVPAARSKN